MNFKEFFKPNKTKIFICILLVIIGIFTTFVGYKIIELFTPIFILPFKLYEVGFIIKLYYFLDYPFSSANLLFINIPTYLTIIIFFLLAYLPACYINKNRKWFKGIAVFLITFLIISTSTIFAIAYWNLFFGFSCSKDSDCLYACEGSLDFVYNYRYVTLKSSDSLLDSNPTIDCSYSIERGLANPICERNRCKVFRGSEAISINDCERATVENVKSSCYFDLAEKLNDINLCNRIHHIYMKPNCITSFAKRLKNPALCNKIENAFSKSVCIREVATATKNLSLCNIIEYQNIKEECLQLLK